MKKIIYVSADGNLWRTHTDDGFIGKPYILKAMALTVAVNHVAAMDAETFEAIKVQRKDGSYFTVWHCDTDEFPPGRIPLKKNKFM